MKLRYSLTGFVLFALVLSCKKYDDGPALSLRSKKERLCKGWITESYSENGVDRTSDWKNTFQNAQIILDKNGNYSIYWKYFGLVDYNETGTWQFTGNKENILFNRQTPSADSWDWHIKRLTKDEFWITDYVNSSDTVGFLKMVPK